MNPHAAPPISPFALSHSLWHHRQLIRQMAWREVAGRYRGSALGIFWSFMNPVFMLAVYTFFFSVVFKARWGTGDESKGEFAVILFAGMVVHGLFAEMLNRAPGLVLANVNYVKRVIFPLEILPVVSMLACLFHSVVSLLVLLLAFVLVNGFLHWTVIFAPLVLLPLVIFTLGLSWLVASLGVFVRDLGQSIPIVTTVMLFLSPVFFAVDSLPARYQPYIMANPLTFIIEQARAVLIWGNTPHWGGLALYTALAVVVAWAGYAWFQKTRKGFADVL